ncbi:MAG: 5-oxoprolinase subunit PxpB [Woeseiaceae bacterium]
MKSLDDLISVPADEPGDAQALAAYLRNDNAWLEVVAGIDSVVVRFDAAAMDTATAERRLADALGSGVPALEPEDILLEIPVVYGGEYGPDLEALCSDLSMTEDEFVALHSGTEYRVEMVGFTPGFAFIGGLDKRLHVPRREQPRQRVAAGSVGIADGRTGIYALPSPGGWTLIGRTPYPLFDATAEDPFRLHVGMRVRFVAVAARVFPA